MEPTVHRKIRKICAREHARHASPTPSSPVGLHRVLEPAGVLPQAAQRLDDRPEIAAGRGADRASSASTSTRRPSASSRPSTAATATRSAREVLEIVAARGKMQNPVTGSGGMLVGVVDEVGPESPLGLSVGDRVATLVSLIADPAADHRRAGALGRALRAGARRGPRHPVRPVDRRRAARRPARRAGAGRAGRLRRPRAHRPGRARLRRGRRVAVDRRRRQERVALAGRRPPGRRVADRRGRARRGGGRRCCARPGSPTPWRSPTPATRWRWPRRSSRPWAGRPT